MSVKVQTFANIITNPLNVHNFYVVIPDADLAEIVRSTSFPGEQLREVTLYSHGESVVYPTLPENSGTWSFSIPESDDGKVRRQFEALKSRLYNQKTGALNVDTWYDVQVMARDLNDNPVFGVILHGCWIRGRGDVSLDASNPTNNWNWDYQFRYQWREDMDFENTGSTAPMGL